MIQRAFYRYVINYFFFNIYFCYLSIFIFFFWLPLRVLGLKYQTVFLPNGMVAGVYGTSGNNNDLGVLNISG
jgi:hypothetical protein